MTQVSAQTSHKKSKEKMNFELLAVETVRALRGKRSQQQLSKELGYSFNQLGKWESFEKRILWSDLMALLELKQIPLREALLLLSLGYEGLSASDVLKELKANLPAAELAKRLGYKRVQFSRWLNGTTDVPLSEMLKIFQLVRNGAAQFIERLLIDSSIPKSLRKSLWPLTEYNFFMEAPWIGLLNLAIDHKNCPPASRAAKFLAKLTGVPQTKVQEALDLMRLYGILQIDEQGFLHRNSRFVLSAHRRGSKVFHQHWVDTVSQAYIRLPEKEQLGLSTDNFFTSLLVGASPQVWKDIVESYRNFLETVRQLIINDPNGAASEYKILVFQALDVQQAGQVMDLSLKKKVPSKSKNF